MLLKEDSCSIQVQSMCMCALCGVICVVMYGVFVTCCQGVNHAFSLVFRLWDFLH